MSSYVSCFIYHVAQLHGEDRKTHNRCLTITTCGFCITGLRSGPGFVKHGGRQCTERRVLNAWEHLRGRTIPVNRPTADGEALRNKEEGMRRRTTDRNTQAHATRKKESLSSLARPITWEDARVLREGRDTHANKDTHTKNTHTHTHTESVLKHSLRPRGTLRAAWRPLPLLHNPCKGLGYFEWKQKGDVLDGKLLHPRRLHANWSPSRALWKATHRMNSAGTEHCYCPGRKVERHTHYLLQNEKRCLFLNWSHLRKSQLPNQFKAIQ